MDIQNNNVIVNELNTQSIIKINKMKSSSHIICVEHPSFFALSTAFRLIGVQLKSSS